jgi:hypothetical protein
MVFRWLCHQNSLDEASRAIDVQLLTVLDSGEDAGNADDRGDADLTCDDCGV